MAKAAVRRFKVSIRFPCRCFVVRESAYYYQPPLATENARIVNWLLPLTQSNKRWGFGLCFLYLKNAKGYWWNHKCVYRVYCELALNPRIRPKKRLKRDKPDALSVLEAPNQVWSTDLMSGSLRDHRTLCTFNVINDYNREGLTIDVDLSLPSLREIRSLENIIEPKSEGITPTGCLLP